MTARLTRWLPPIVAFLAVVALVLAAGTPVVELARYCAYAVWAVLLPGTLVYRALRATPRTLVEDVAMGAAVGLTLELVAWAAFSALELRFLLPGWPLVVVAFFLTKRLRRHWRPAYPDRPSVAWSWSLAAIVVFWTLYLYVVFLARNPVVPTSEQTMQYLDLSYQLSLAGEAKNHLPLHVPQVAGEPLNYHWFAYAHMAMASLVGGADLAAVSLRFAIPALCALTIVLTAVVGARVSRKPWVGVVAAALFFTVGEFNFTDPVTMPFGTQATFVIWHGMSMIYSWALLVALIGVLVPIITGEWRSWRGYLLAALLIAASSGAKASSLPVVLAALLLVAVAQLVRTKRIPWPVVLLGLLAAAGQFFATAVLYRFQTYATDVNVFGSLAVFAGPPAGEQRGWWEQAAVAIGVFVAFLLNMQLRLAGIIPLLWRQRLRLEPAQWLLLGGALGGVAAYLLVRQLSDGQQYFARAGFAFGVLLSAWGFVDVFDRARLSARARWYLGAFAAFLAVATVLAQLADAGRQTGSSPFAPVTPILKWSFFLLLCGVAGALVWYAARGSRPELRGKGGLVVLTAILVVGAPGLVMDMVKSARSPNGGAYYNTAMPRSRVLAARWVRDHSSPGDVLATNVHCLPVKYVGQCDPRTFWLSAYAERRVLVEGWTFAPRIAGDALKPFWDQELLERNDRAFTEPTPDDLAALKADGVRWLVADSRSGQVSPELAEYADLWHTEGQVSVYELR
ncbi:hypothetical protein AB0M47_27560 [Hamadaea sp. NPDC051192]|uniref:hypothetical protein n=1 Tax=Hamadaea sp. NPDC051192 TaxID=3154940 RepID=UPI0034451C3C